MDSSTTKRVTKYNAHNNPLIKEMTCAACAVSVESMFFINVWKQARHGKPDIAMDVASMTLIGNDRAR